MEWGRDLGQGRPSEEVGKRGYSMKTAARAQIKCLVVTSIVCAQEGGARICAPVLEPSRTGPLPGTGRPWLCDLRMWTVLAGEKDTEKAVTELVNEYVATHFYDGQGNPHPSCPHFQVLLCA